MKQRNSIVNSKWIFAFASVILFVSLSCGSAKHRRRVRKKQGVYHTVKKGQTLWRIARTYGVKLEAIARVNGIPDASRIKAGQKIFIPGARRVKYVEVKKNRYAKPKFIWPVKGKFTSSFGMRNNRRHDGIDIAAPKGSYIKVSASGKVIFSGWGPTGYGKIVIVKHSGDLITVYAHNQKNIVKKGQYVRQGEYIARIGNTGRTTGPHLHFEVRRNRTPQDPLLYLP